MIPQCIHGKFLRVRIPLERFAVDRVSGPLWVGLQKCRNVRGRDVLAFELVGEIDQALVCGDIVGAQVVTLVRGLGQFHENLADRVVEKSWRQMGLVPIEPLAIGSEISIELSWV